MRPITVASSAGSPSLASTTRSTGMPASRAIAATVSGLSPEITRSSTPSRRKNSTVERASPRSSSARTTRPWAARPFPNASTRRPASRSAAARSPSASEVEELRRAEPPALALDRERAVAAIGGERLVVLDRRRLGRDRVRDRAQRRVLRGRAGGEAAERLGDRLRARSPTTRRPGCVSVPVLSRQSTSTAASDSVAFSCCASAPRRASCSAAAANVSAERAARALPGRA